MAFDTIRMYLQRTERWEHDDPGEIGAVCRGDSGVTFTMAASMSVRADPAHPLWADLARQPGSRPPAWNFSKYLVGADGHLRDRWPTKVAPGDPDIAEAIEAALGAA